MKICKPFLSEKVAQYDLVLLRVLGEPASQVLQAKVEKVYSARKGITNELCGNVIEFVRAPGNWGDIPMQIGDRALVFMSAVSGKLYQDPWRGHLLLEDIDDDLFAIYQYKELWLSEEIPEEIMVRTQQDPRRPYASAILFNTLESYLQALISKLP